MTTARIRDEIGRLRGLAAPEIAALVDVDVESVGAVVEFSARCGLALLEVLDCVDSIDAECGGVERLVTGEVLRSIELALFGVAS